MRIIASVLSVVVPTLILLAPAVAAARPRMNDQTPLPDNLYLADLDGNGVPEFVQFNGTRLFDQHTEYGRQGMMHFYFPNVVTGLVVGSFDGGSRDEVCAKMVDGSLSCYGESPDHTTLWWWFTQGDFIGPGDQVIVGDYDGNGTDDLMVYTPSTGNIGVYTLDPSGFFFDPMPQFSLGNLSSVAVPGMQFRAANIGPRSSIFALSPNGQLSYFAAVFDGTNNTFWWASNTASGFVPAGADVSTARINDDTLDDIVVHTQSGAYSFYEVDTASGTLVPIQNVSTGQLDTSASALVFWGSLNTYNEPGGQTRSDALVYEPGWDGFVRADARWDGSQYTYWWIDSDNAPANEQGWPATKPSPWAILLCKYSDQSVEPNTFDVYQQDFGAQGSGNQGLYDYFRDISWGTVDLGLGAGTTVFPTDGTWLTTNITYAQTQAQGRGAFGQACVAAAHQAGFDTSPFYNVVAVENYGGNLSGYDGTYVETDQGGLQPAFLGHEMLHAYGLNHSYNYNGTIQYGDPWDIMSALATYQFTGASGRSSGPDLNAAYKAQLQWIPSSRLVTIASPQSTGQNYAIAATSRPEANAPLAIQANQTGGSYYTVEFRLAEKWDSGFPRSAVFVHKFVAGQNISEVQVSNNAGNADLQPGDNYSDGQLSVSVVSFNADGTATVYVYY